MFSLHPLITNRGRQEGKTPSWVRKKPVKYRVGNPTDYELNAGGGGMTLRKKHGLGGTSFLVAGPRG